MMGRTTAPLHNGMRTFVYIDGLNLARSAEPYGYWLDPVKFVSRVMPARCQIDKVKYFTTKLSAQPDHAEATRRALNQEAYHEALRASGVEMIYGHMNVRTIVRPIINLPIAGMKVNLPGGPVVFEEGRFDVIETVTEDHAPASEFTREVARVLVVGAFADPSATRTALSEKKWGKPTRPPRKAVYAEVSTREEKGTDVNMAVHLVNDVAKDWCDFAVVISNDADFAGAITMARQEHHKEVWVVFPARTKLTRRLVEAASVVRRARKRAFEESQFPDNIPGTAISIPEDYRRALANPGRLWLRGRK